MSVFAADEMSGKNVWIVHCWATCPTSEGEEAERHAAMIGQNPGLGFAVDDCQATYEELQERGVEFISDPEERPWGLEAVAHDLYGNPIILYEYTSEAP